MRISDWSSDVCSSDLGAVKSGPRNRKIIIERFTATTDDYGHGEKTWTDYCTEWAAVNFGTGQERREAAQESASVSATRSEERREGNECGSTCSSRWTPNN